MHPQALPWLIAYTSALVAIAAFQLQCGLDKKINIDNFEEYVGRGEIGNVFASACGRNRGVFVIDPPDGHTYSCARFPVEWNTTDANGIKKDPNPEHALEILRKFVESVFISTPEYIREKDPGSCDFEAMSAFTCGKEEPWRTAPWYDTLQAPIRAVNIGGLFVLKPWITPGLAHWGETTGIVDQKTFSEKCHTLGVCATLETHWNSFYTQNDFDQMKSAGLNAVRIPVGYWYFGRLSTAGGLLSSSSLPYILPTESIRSISHPLTKIIQAAYDADLQVILDLEPITQENLNDVQIEVLTISAATAIAKYIDLIEKKFELDNVMLLEIGSTGSVDMSSSIEAVSETYPSLPVLVLETSTTPFKKKHSHVYLNNKVYFGFSVPDIASDNPPQDREKMFAHEKIACGYKAPLHFNTCQRAPVFVGEFSLATENCLPLVDPDYKDFGQCAHISSRAVSPWWQRHQRSFAMRQIDTFERELGWAFMTYKLEDAAESDPSAVFWSFRKAVSSGLIDLSLTSATHPDKPDACAFSPAADFLLGDDTLAPTPEPTEPWWVPPTSPDVKSEGGVDVNRKHHAVHAPTIAPIAAPTSTAPVSTPPTPVATSEPSASTLTHKVKKPDSTSGDYPTPIVAPAKKKTAGILVVFLFLLLAVALLGMGFYFWKLNQPRRGYASIPTTTTSV